MLRADFAPRVPKPRGVVVSDPLGVRPCQRKWAHLDDMDYADRRKSRSKTELRLLKLFNVDRIEGYANSSV